MDRTRIPAGRGDPAEVDRADDELAIVNVAGDGGCLAIGCGYQRRENLPIERANDKDDERKLSQCPDLFHLKPSGLHS
jgi:hypothetical protein